MKQEDSKILDKLGKDAGFKVPEHYFDDFAKNLTENLPEVKITEVDEKPNMWVRIRPYVYMAAMFAGIWCMMHIFSQFNGSNQTRTANAPGNNAGATMVEEQKAGDTMVTNYEDSVRNGQTAIEEVK